jgi:hypothetical protein
MYNPRADFKERILKSQLAFETPDAPSTNLTSLNVRMQIAGFAYKATLASYLSGTVLLVHMGIAVTDVIWAVLN